MKRSIISLATIAVFLVIGGNAKAGQLTIPNSFSSGATASASAVNENFLDVETAVNDNDTRISALETTGADITGVTAGSGLTGGATSGNATLSVGTGAITGSHIQSSTVTDLDIADEPGIDWAGSMNMQITATTWARVGTYSVSITAPTSGYIHVTFTGYTYQYSATVSYYGISTSSTCSAIYATANTGNQSLSFSGVNYNGFSMQWVFSVAAGTSIYYPCSFKGGTSSPYIQSAYMTAVFYPTRY